MRNARKIFTDVVEGRNCFTPVLDSYFLIPHGAIELSRDNQYGRRNLTESRFMEDVYGVTVVLDGKHRSDLGELFNSRKEAIAYIMTFKPTQRGYRERVDCYGTMRDRVEKLK